jgi:flagellin-like protein
MHRKTRRSAPKSSWKDRRAVSPVIGEVLMVAITITLAGVLVYYITSLPSQGGDVETWVGANIEKTADGNWAMNIISGKIIFEGVTMLIINTSTGMSTFNAPINAANTSIDLHNNDGDAYLGAGDVIILKPLAGVIEPGFAVQLLKSGNIITGPMKIPS